VGAAAFACSGGRRSASATARSLSHRPPLQQRHGGNRSLALREALKVQEVMEDWLDQIETANAGVLREQKERSEKGFREGRFTTWEEVKRRLRL